MGRPRASETRKIYRFRLSDSEHQTIMEKADMAGLTFSEYLRRSALGKRIRSKLNVKAMAELNRLGGLQKLAIMQAPEYRPQLNGVIREIVKVLKVLGEKREL